MKLVRNNPTSVARLLRACADGERAKASKHDVIFNAAANMLEQMGSCVPYEGEPSFRLLARDPQAPDLVDRWAYERERYEPNSPKPKQAEDIADDMREWKRIHPDIGLQIMPEPIRKYYLEITLIEKLCGEDEGNSVEILCPNPDFNGQPDRAIAVTADWIVDGIQLWTPRRFTGNTLLECLKKAWDAMQARTHLPRGTTKKG